MKTQQGLLGSKLVRGLKQKRNAILPIQFLGCFASIAS
jgi:hypothetical protein